MDVLHQTGTPRVSLMQSPLQRRCERDLDAMASGFVRLTGERPLGLRENLHIVRRREIEAILARTTEGLAPTTGRPAAPPPAAMQWLQKELGRKATEFMSQRVLGLYVPRWQSAENSGLYVVEENISTIAAASGVDPGALLDHVVTHEAVHQWQDRSHPWLGNHMRSLSANAMQGLSLRALLHARGDLSQAGPGIVELNAVMGLMEGHAEFMTDAVLDSNGANQGIGRMLNARREAAQPNVRLQVLLNLTGMAGKTRQYGEGYRFCTEVARVGGIGLVQRAWEGPETLPTAPEIADPARWIARIQRLPAPPKASAATDAVA